MRTTEGNLGSLVNSTRDEYSPLPYGNSLLFLTNRTLSDEQSYDLPADAQEVMFESARRMDASFTPADVLRHLPLNSYRSGAVTAGIGPDSVAILIFARQKGVAKDANVDLYQTELRDGQWTPPIALEILNSKGWDSQPSLSADGNTLVFASDRAGGSGGIDLYVSQRTVQGWSAPKNCGPAVNSALDDITPSIDRNGILYFASNRNAAKSGRGFELMRAADNGPASWANVEVLPAPFNSESDDINPVVWGDSLFFSSRRPGGCGGYDLYGVVLCGPVMLRGEIRPSNSLTRRAGILNILDSTGRMQQIRVPEDGRFEVRLNPNRQYQLRYINDCAEDIIQQDFMTPCHETKTVVLQSKLDLPEVHPVFNFDEYNVPFFASGYYRPNTTEEMNVLRLRSAYNLVGVSPQTAYIVPPGDEYEAFAPIVDSALHHATEFIINVLEFRRRGCNTSTAPIHIHVAGYADPKPFTKAAQYDGVSINDPEYQLSVKNGEQMNNSLLATLRAYYTVKVLQSMLSSNTTYQQLSKRLQWHISAQPDDRSAAPDTLKRRVELSVGDE